MGDITTAFIYYRGSNDHINRIMKVFVALLALVACAAASDLFDCEAEHGTLWIEVCCELNISKEEKSAPAVPSDDVCSCGIDMEDPTNMKLTYHCQCLGQELASCTADIQEIINGKYAVCCKFGIE